MREYSFEELLKEHFDKIRMEEEKELEHIEMLEKRRLDYLKKEEIRRMFYDEQIFPPSPRGKDDDDETPSP